MKNHRFSIGKNSLFNVLGWVVPILVNFFSIPIIVKRLGYDQYGIWTLVMAVIGYFALLDLGVVRGGIRFIAESNARNDIPKRNQVISLCALFYFGVGLIGCALILVSTATFILRMLEISIELEPLARIVFNLAAVGFLTTMMQAYLLSLPQALHRFDISNKVDIAFQVLNTALVLIALFLGQGLVSLIVIRIATNLLTCVSLVFVTIKCFPSFRWTFRIPKSVISEILSYSLISFIGRVGHSTGNYLQTLVVGTIVGTTAVTLFSIPFQVVSRISNISPKLAFVLFPISSELSASGDVRRLHNIYLGMTKYIFFMNVFVVTLFSCFSWDLLCLWMGKEFADQASVLLILISIGYFFNSMTNLPSQICDGMNHPKITSAFAFISGAVCIFNNLVGGYLWGIIGVAAGFMLSSTIMALAFNLYVHPRVIRLPYRTVVAGAYAETAIFGLLVIAIFLPFTLLRQKEVLELGAFLLKASGIVLLFCLYGYARVLNGERRRQLRDKLRLYHKKTEPVG